MWEICRHEIIFTRVPVPESSKVLNNGATKTIYADFEEGLNLILQIQQLSSRY